MIKLILLKTNILVRSKKKKMQVEFENQKKIYLKS